MILLKGTIQDGQVVLQHPANLPDGTAVTVVSHEFSSSLGIPDEEWPTDPDGIAQLLSRMNDVEPFELTTAEEADIEAWRLRVKEYTIANQDKTVEGMFE